MAVLFSYNSENSEKLKYSDHIFFIRVTGTPNETESCKVDAVVTVDSKGQLVLPKDIREKAKLKSNDKLAVIGCQQSGEICCIILIKADKLGNVIKGFLSPILKEALE